MTWQPSEMKLCLVEGKEEVALLKHFCNHLNLTAIDIKDYGGKDKLGSFLKALVSQSAFRQVRSLAILRDADEKADDAFRSVVGAAERADLRPPRNPGETGQGRPSVRILILPDGMRPGMLEDACLESIQDRPVMTCVEKLFDCVREVGEPLPKEVKMSKAKLYAYLATLPDPGRRLAEKAGSETFPFNLDSPAFEPIRKLLRSL
ncbi:MAG: hypothetical protein JXQ75_16920 [Phycisphaerae bacterium]|nr:hypothetical protein [Phycisphaerae bacterium]